MAKTRRKKAAVTGRQAPAGAWTPAALLCALRRGTDNDRVAALRKAGIIDVDGNLTKTYQNWGSKVTPTPNARGAD